jgi:hypothetical protein
MLEVTGDVEFAYGETPENYDVVYGLVDNLILRYLQTAEGSGISIPAFYQKYMDYVGDLSTRIIDVSSDFLTEILGGIAKKSRTPLAL